MNRKVLVVEDDVDLSRLVAMHLRDIGCETVTIADGVEGLAEARSGAYGLTILDVMLPGMSGLDICKSLRTERNYMPILMLTARSTELDRISGLELGADDYLTKPFSILELVARVKAVFRRVEALMPEHSESVGLPLSLGEVDIFVDEREVEVRGERVALTNREFDLLLYFARHPGRVFSRSQLLDGVWGYAHSGYEHTVNSHINRLRAKLEKDPRRPEMVCTVWGAGYKLVPTR